MTGCTAPTGAVNAATNCGYQGGEETKAAEKIWEKSLQADTVTDFYSDGTHKSYSVPNRLAFLLKTFNISQSDIWPSAAAMPTASSFSIGYQRQKEVQQRCNQAAKTIKAFLKSHAGMVVPDNLIQAAESCGSFP